MDANILVPVILFIVLSPGFLLRLPPGASNTVVTLTHAAVFAGIYYFLRRTFPQYY
jgi:hypothetical protein